MFCQLYGDSAMSSAAMDIKVGDKLPSCEITVSQELIDVYAAISGDFNPIHVDAAAGAASVFGGTIAHGCIPMEPFFQSVLRWSGRESLPPQATMNFRYRAPSRPGDLIHSDAEVTAHSVTDQCRTVEISFVCANQRGETVIDGQCRLSL